MSGQPKLLDQTRAKLRARHYSYRTEQQYVYWIRRYVIHHGKRHPSVLGAPEVEAFLSDLAVRKRISASTQNQALSAILFLYRHVRGIDLPWLENVTRAQTAKRIPVVLSAGEVRALLGHLDGQLSLVGQLLYGAGLRLMEALRLRVKDVDFGYSQIIVRDGKGHKDRVTMLPEAVVPRLKAHLTLSREQHVDALRYGFAGVELPHALARKFPAASKE